MVNNVGIGYFEIIEMMIYEWWLKIIDVNFNGVFFGIKIVVEWLKLCGGFIVNVVLIEGFVGDLVFLVYNVSKGVVCIFIKLIVIFCVCLGYNICVNFVCFGFVEIKLVLDVLMVLGNEVVEVVFVGIIVCILMGCFGWLEEIVLVIVFFVFDDVSYVIGFDFVVDGGFMV